MTATQGIIGIGIALIVDVLAIVVFNAYIRHRHRKSLETTESDDPFGRHF